MVSYIFETIYEAVIDFFYDWYVRFFYLYWRTVFNYLRKLDRVLALKVTFYYWFKPLYQDYTLIGYVLGIPFRTFRIILSLLVYLFYFIIVAIIFLIWILFPVFFIFSSFKPLTKF